MNTFFRAFYFQSINIKIKIVQKKSRLIEMLGKSQQKRNSAHFQQISFLLPLTKHFNESPLFLVRILIFLS